MPLYKGSTDLILVSGMSEYTFPSQLLAETTFGSQELKQPGTESNTEPQPFFPESGPQTRTCSINTTWALVRNSFSEPERHAESDSAFKLEFWGCHKPIETGEVLD